MLAISRPLYQSTQRSPVWPSQNGSGGRESLGNRARERWPEGYGQSSQRLRLVVLAEVNRFTKHPAGRNWLGSELADRAACHIAKHLTAAYHCVH